MKTSRKTYLRGSAAAIVLLLAAALTAPSATAVVGTPGAAEHTFIARLEIGGEVDGRACSGALVHAQWVLTAASCLVVDPASGQRPASGAPTQPIEVTIGRNDLTTDAGQVRGGDRVVVHPDRDLALVRTDRAVSSSITPVAVSSSAPVVGESLLVPGFGRTATEWSPLQAHTGTFTVSALDAGDLILTGQNGAVVCAGDAGGPALRETATGVELVAVNSRSWQGGCFGADPAETRTTATEARVDDIRSWVTANASKASMIVVPHPDDEFQAWSLVEHSPDNYKVFVVATRGEQTRTCDPATLANTLQEDLGEIPPTPTPTGKWTTSCADARMNAMLGFLTEMSEHDPSLPGDWSAARDVGPFAANGVSLCRVDDGVKSCDATAQRTARVWLDVAGRGALVSYDLGDGDLTEAEVAWAIRTTIAQRSALGLPAYQRVHNLAGTFSNVRYDCVAKEHPDHRAVHVALWQESFGAGYAAGATCADDPSAVREGTVSAGSVDAAFEVGADGTRIGAHARNYGWLHSSYYPLDRTGQRTTFHVPQSFWERRNG